MMAVIILQDTGEVETITTGAGQTSSKQQLQLQKMIIP